MSERNELLSHFVLKLAGTNPPPALVEDLLEITVESSLHMPDVATITIHDPRLQWVDAQTLLPGVKATIEARSGRRQVEVFDGEIVEIEPEFVPGTQRLVVRAFDRLHRLARGRHTRTFVNATDSDIARRLAQEAGLQFRGGPAGEVHQYVLQSNQTNLEFLQERAAALGYMLFVHKDTLHFEEPRSSGAPVELKWGETLGEFRPRMSTIGQVTSVTARGWDPAQKQAVTARSGKPRIMPKVGVRGSGGATAQQAFSIEAAQLVTGRAIRTTRAATVLAQAEAERLESRFIEAEGSAAGIPAIVAGATLKLTGLGTRFSGSYFVTNASHHYSAGGGYSTRFSVSGLNAATLLTALMPERQPALGATLVIALVTDNQDPQNLGRVKVKYPWLTDEHASDWARVVAVGAGNERGISFLPEINDEVLVGFEFGDIHQPFVLGGLWNGRDKPALPNNQAMQGSKVQKRIIRSRTGHTITFDDADSGGGIEVRDSKGNQIKIDSQRNELTIAIKGNATIEAQGNLALRAKGNLTLEAQGKADLKGMGVAVDGGAATVDVKGTMINLN
jgi:phage protein D